MIQFTTYLNSNYCNRILDSYKNEANSTTTLEDIIPAEDPKHLMDSSRELEVGDYIVVRLVTTKSIVKYFVAQVTTKLHKNTKNLAQSGKLEYEVKFLKQYLSNFVFPRIDDFSLIERKSVMQILEPPNVARRNQLSFNDLKFKIE